ncbi:MAG: hypothetical protein B7O98_07590 [Zestosphaera tikiterensis]|uniref:Radical SAM core domain-containing protein n=1 Tax=Zestosphaera tikiterensis TaxID=1973259 RepID=A0A2R7Y4N2_9CREN|nr:MAG: hypothetical protein B7O98_07590 [Zestosphaera tikiterensis]
MITTQHSVVLNGVKYVWIKVKSALVKSGLKDYTYALNPYVGCYHGCNYCYARAYVRYPDVRDNWGYVVYIKENLPQILRSEVRKLKPAVVGLGTTTDPYQPIEAVTKITRESLNTLLKNRFKVVIQTKSSLVIRDLDILKERKDLVELGFTITTLDQNLSRALEPRASPPKARVEALRKAASAGIRTWIFLGPIIPGVNDSPESIKEVLEVARESSSTVYYDWLRFKPGLESFFSYLNIDLSRYLSGDEYKIWRRKTSQTILKICEELNVKCASEFNEYSIT